MAGSGEQRGRLVHAAGGRLGDGVLGVDAGAARTRRPLVGRQQAEGEQVRRRGATAHSRAAELDSPAPSGTRPSTATSRPGHGIPRLAQCPRHPGDVGGPPARAPGGDVGERTPRPRRRPGRTRCGARSSSRGRTAAKVRCGSAIGRHEPVVVVGVLADQVDPARRGPHAGRLGAEGASRNRSAAVVRRVTGRPRAAAPRSAPASRR